MLNEKTQKDLQLLFNDVKQYLNFDFNDIKYFHFAFLKERLIHTLKSNEELQDFLDIKEQKEEIKEEIGEVKEIKKEAISLRNRLRYRRIHRGTYARL